MQQENSNESIERQLEILADAISDVGYWTWWVEQLPEMFQAEFGGIQLYFPSESIEEAPASRVALCFDNPVSVSFISKIKDDNFHWVTLLQEDQIEPPNCSHGEFSFGNTSLAKSLIDEIVEFKTIYGTDPRSVDFLEFPISLVFWCRNIGLAVAGKEVRLLNHSGDIALGEVSDLHESWWQYWRRYWDALDTQHPFPKDYVCNVTIPVKR
ncbi:MAG: hypothetical protein EOO88_01315 [Pedobacter sp.]|nr:MAG: hypothetical protein EOO88_01315 [Pedobacter sp.]